MIAIAAASLFLACTLYGITWITQESTRLAEQWTGKECRFFTDKGGLHFEAGKDALRRIRDLPLIDGSYGPSALRCFCEFGDKAAVALNTKTTFGTFQTKFQSI